MAPSFLRIAAALAALSLVLAMEPLLAQSSADPPTSPSPSEPAPPAPPVAAPTAPLPDDGLAMVPPPAETDGADEVELPGKPAAILRGSANWDEGYAKMTEAFARLAADLEKAGIKATGKPITIFLDTDDTSFRYEALLPIAAEPTPRPPGLPADIGFGRTPAGKAIRFVHQAPYDDIDGTYEAVTAYLDSKGVEVKDAFIEEYLTLGKDSADPALQLYIYVQPK